MSTTTMEQQPQHQHLTLLSRKPSFVQKATSIKAPLLQPVALAPLRVSSAASAFASLERIERIEIRETRVRDGKTFYVLDVFLYHFNSRLPTNVTNHRALVRSTTPDFSVERRFSEFAKLRSQVYDSSILNPQHMCAYCAEFIMYVRFKLQQPRALAKLTMGTEQRRKMLAGFITDFVQLGKCKEKQNHCCETHAPVPHLIDAFVRDENATVGGSGEHADPLASRLSWA
ncbi:hypothetical protein Gpo141_00010602 [Globisporangium polare]